MKSLNITQCRIMFVSLIILLVTASFHKSGSLTVVVEITNLRSNNGTVLVALYDKGDKFPQDAARFAIGKQKVEINNKSARVSFPDLSPGRYAISILHDENNNLKMDYNFLGIPREGYGFSNNAQGVFGPPSFKKASFELGSSNKAVRIKMQYL